MTKPRVLLVYGGESSEHDVSVTSARNVYKAIDKKKYDVRLAYIDKEGRWWLLSKWLDDLTKHDQTQLVAAPGTGYFLTVPGSKAIHIDVIVPVLHGKNGEDGTLQGMAAMMHIRFVGCGIQASANCMDKTLTKRILRSYGLPVVPWIEVTKDNYNDILKGNRKSILRALGKGPWFVKPSRSGSSVGVTKVSSYETLEDAVRHALDYDSVALIEKAIKGRELEVAVLGNPPAHLASGVGEIIPGEDFYDYDDKYAAESKSQLVLSAKLSKKTREKIRIHALNAYQVLGCEGLSRVDFLMGKGDAIYVNEINTFPGFTNNSMYPKLWQEEGIEYGDLIDRLITLALE